MSDIREHGDRAAFLDRLRHRLAGSVPPNPVHVPPPPLGTVPPIVYRDLGDGDLSAAFRRTATAMGAVVHDATEDIDAVLRGIVQRHDVGRAVVTPEPEAVALTDRLTALGVVVDPYERGAAAAADLGVTGAVAAIAATGSVVVNSGVDGGRGASLLPRVHLCVVGPERLVAVPAEALARFDDDPDGLPANVVFITGPSRTGDIEQLLTIGVHGPVAVHIVFSA